LGLGGGASAGSAGARRAAAGFFLPLTGGTASGIPSCSASSRAAATWSPS